ncbi:hypothetical protein WN944_009426 [Citrus x changshan-huyou]|uniref:Uncharacterized protein n=1 Tax=Citrus x changshan-huyou TaxID=2935761 RepID=A0AAP0MW57_9ROSI
MTEKKSERQTKPAETVTGNAAPASMLGDGARSTSCALPTAVIEKSAAMKRIKATALQILACSISVLELKSVRDFDFVI